MNQKALIKLEYDKIIARLKEKASSSKAKQIAGELIPLNEPITIKKQLSYTSEAVSLISRKGALPLGQVYDVVNSVIRARKGASLSMKEILEVGYDLRVVKDVISFMKSEDDESFPLITDMVSILVDMPELVREIERCIISEDEMSDNASPKLREIRRSIVLANESIKSKLNRIVTSSTTKSYLQDAIVTIRDGRYVIPVKQEHRGKLQGIVHQQSKGGATIFVEPQAVVELNNKIRELSLAEHAEIARILAELSSRIAENSKLILSDIDVLSELDFVMAKGKLSIDMGGEEPHISVDKSFSLIEARHPLIEQEKVVPIDIIIDDLYNALIITGPNTGGKTVSLKTTGLLTLMTQSGLHIPASSESRIRIFDDVFADIGDEQSIEQSLSTFSSHMKNIVAIVDESHDTSLILLDELGAGTDPTEGAALAISILDTLRAKGASILATTHYNELKKYAISTEGVMNAAMDFDVETLSPTYKLRIGIPGKSNAFEISKKLGIKREIIDRATEMLEKGDIEFEHVVSSIQEDKNKAQAERIEAEAIKLKLQKLEEKLSAKETAIENKRAAIIEEAHAEARAILKEVRDTGDDVKRQLREISKGTQNVSNTRAYEKAIRKLRDTENIYAKKVVKQVNSEPVSAADIEIGDKVKVLSLNQNGSVVTLPDDKDFVMVSIGSMKVNVKLHDIMIINEGKDRKKPPAKNTRYGSIYRRKSSFVSASLKVQGKSLEEATAESEKYIDDAYIAGLESVTIIHGRGEGILRTGIRRMLKHNSTVKSFRSGNYNEGGEGITVVTLRKT